LTWHGVKVGQPDWRMSSHSIALTVEIPDEGLTIYLIANAYWETLDFELPQIGRPAISWRRWINTALDSPQDIVHWEAALPAPSSVVQAKARSVIVFLAEARGGRH
ncbi:MAG: glycogen debranching enzyme, partial [Candidatus Binatia bacterium]